MEDVRRGGVTNRFSNKLSRKSKKRMLKKLRLADDDENMNHKKQEKMMCYKCPSDLETNVSYKKKKRKSKLPKKDTYGVDHHASVPRKLRSAMMKRNLESVKENQEMDAKAILVPESISKDEKEVAETLYGLADMFTDTDSIDNKACDPFSSDANPKQFDEDRLQQQDHNQCSLTGLKQSSSVNVTDAPVSTRAIETKVPRTDMYYKSNGLALWPGLSSTRSSSSTTTKLPHWMGQAVSPTKNASLLSEPLRVRPRKFTKCASHIYICRLIKALQTSKSSPLTVPLNQTKERSLEMSQCRLSSPVTTVSDFKTMVTPSKRYQSPKHVQENMTQLSLQLYGPHTTQKQGQQRSPYLPSRFQTAYNANQQQQQQLQKRLWAAQYRPPPSRITVPPFSNQYSKPGLSLNLTSIQTLQVASSPRYINNISQQQHRFMAAAAMAGHHHHNHNQSRTVMNRQEHYFPLIYEETRTPLQLLYNEQS